MMDSEPSGLWPDFAVKIENARSSLARGTSKLWNTSKPSEARRKMLKAGVRRDVLQRRIELEVTMSKMLPRMLLFVLSFSLFVAVQQLQYDPSGASDTNQHMRDHYRFQETLVHVSNVPALVKYTDKFLEASNQINPLDIFHWCADEETVELPIKRIRCTRDEGKPKDQVWSEHYVDIADDSSGRRLHERAPLAASIAGEPFRDHRLKASTDDRAARGTRGTGRSDPSPAESARRASPLRPRKQAIRISLPPSAQSSSLAAAAAASARAAAAKLPAAEGEALASGPQPFPVSNTSGVVGVAVNGVLLFGRHHDPRGRAQAIAWNFDDCGGHVDRMERYHYHFPPSCLLVAHGGAGPSSPEWWTSEDPRSHWPLRGPPSPTLGFALDGIPIKGPYGADGRLIGADELDECNGMMTEHHGRQDYHYVWTVGYPFLPQCFRGEKPSPPEFLTPPGEPCEMGLHFRPKVVSSLDSAKTRVGHSGPSNDSGPVAPSRDRVEVSSDGCPDHRSFRGSVKAATVSPDLDPRPSSEGRQLESCSGSASSSGCCGAPNSSDPSSSSGGCAASSCCSGAGGCAAPSCCSGAGGCAGSSCCAGAGGCSGSGCCSSSESDCCSSSGGGPAPSWCYASPCSAEIIELFNPCDAGFSSGNSAGTTPPAYYNRYRSFSMSEASIAPPIICQQRRVPKDCDSPFVRGYNLQPHNPLYNAPFDAPKRDPILRCRSDEWDTSTHLGFAPRSSGASPPQYCTFMSEGMLESIKEFDWIDDMTEVVFIANLAYAPKKGTVSIIKAYFHISDSGRILPSGEVLTHTAIVGGGLLAEVLLATIIALMSVRLWFLLRSCLRRAKQEVATGFPKIGAPPLVMVGGDLLLTVSLLVFGVVLLVRHFSRTPVITQALLSLVDSFLQVTDITSSEAVADTFGSILSAIDSIQSVVIEEQVLRVIGYVLILCGILRIIGFMSVHPRVDIIARTVTQAGDDMFHFMMVFGFVFSVMAWLGHWSFGPEHEDFQTFSHAIETCFRMLLGEFPFRDGGTEGMMQRIWYYCFAFLVYFVLINIFLAIVVEAFLSVKKQSETNRSDHNIVLDLFFLLTTRLLRWSAGWASQLGLLRHLVATSSIEAPLTVDELVHSRFAHFRDERSVELLLLTYLRICGDALLTETTRIRLTKQSDFVRQVDLLQAMLGIDSAEVPRALQSILRMQRSWRRWRWSFRRRRRRREEVSDAKRPEQAVDFTDGEGYVPTERPDAIPRFLIHGATSSKLADARARAPAFQRNPTESLPPPMTPAQVPRQGAQPPPPQLGAWVGEHLGVPPKMAEAWVSGLSPAELLELARAAAEAAEAAEQADSAGVRFRTPRAGPEILTRRRTG